MPERLGIGIDFGTTNSAAAVYDGKRLQLVRLEAHDAIMPSATYIDTALRADTGQHAIDRYIQDNTGRTVEMVPEVIGETSQFVEHGDEEHPSAVDTVTQKVYGQPMTDSGLPGRLFRGTKRLLGDERVRRLLVFDHPFRLVALITPILLRIRKSVEASCGTFPEAHLGHPVNFEGRDDYRNQLALSRLSEAYRYAGVQGQRFYPEPIAAAVSYLHTGAFSGTHLLTVDFGGGTLDLCILRRRGMAFDVVATHGIGLGGDHIDQRLFRELLFPLLGKGEIWRRRGMDREIETLFPFEDYEDLLVNWAVTYTLNQNRYTAPVMDCIVQGGTAARKFQRLRDIIKRNASYMLFQCIKDLKATLSEQDSAKLDIPELDIELTVTRERFESIIADILVAVAEVVDATVARAGLAHKDIDVVLRTGGSSLIPAVTRILEGRFPGRVDLHDPFTSVAAGLAIASYEGLAPPG
ncbi:MAG: Hsp70 family protein [Pseudomonadales bacterium]|nr:Hsp70 family protein [Pseudomonadales bacterium]MCP5186069.1 Hsp70 family protein [Pseudomonadales bacterium]